MLYAFIKFEDNFNDVLLIILISFKNRIEKNIHKLWDKWIKFYLNFKGKYNLLEQIESFDDSFGFGWQKAQYNRCIYRRSIYFLNINLKKLK